MAGGLNQWLFTDVFKMLILPEFDFLFYQVVLLEDVRDSLAEELVEKCPVHVFDIEDLSKGWGLQEFG